MAMQELINQAISPLKMGDSAEKAQRWMEELHCTVLPVVDEQGFYKGLVSENTVLELWGQEIAWDLLALQYENTFLYDSQHWQNAINLLDYHRDMLCLIDDTGLFLGAFSSKDIVKKISMLYSFQEESSLLMLSVNQQDYSLSEISRLVETNNAKIVHLFIDTLPQEPFRLLITLKINQTDISRIIATFERFNYEIAGKYHQNLVFDDMEQDRLGLLMKYLSF